MSTLATIGAAAAGTFLGVSAMLIMQNQDKKQIENAKLERIKERKRRYIEKKMMRDFVIDAKQNAVALQENTNTTKKPKRRVHLYFDENDEMVEREDDEEEDKELKDLKPGKADLNLDIDILKKKLKQVQQKQSFKTKITVNLGNEEYNVGKTKITADIFDGNNKTQNAEVFIENLNKTKHRHLMIGKSPEKLDEAESQYSNDYEDIKKIKEPQENVIMDLDPKNFKKKDHIFMDFFSMYGQNFINDKKG